MTKTSTAKPFAPNARVSFKDGYRPVASTLPLVMEVFLSTRRETVVLIDGKPVRLATVALTKV